MPAVQHTAFNGGEISPWVGVRHDLEKYRASCQKLENFLLTPYGGVFSRPGLAYVGKAKHADRSHRLVAFRFSTSTTYLLEFGHLTLRVWSRNSLSLVESAPGVPLEIATPYEEGDLSSLQFAQANDVLYIASPARQPQKLSRVTATNWTLEAFAPSRAPQYFKNEDDTLKITPSGKDGVITLSASKDYFSTEDVGTTMAIEHPQSGTTAPISLSASANSSVLYADREIRAQTNGTWYGNLYIQSSPNNEDWTTLRHLNSNGNANFNVTILVDEPIYIRLVFGATPGTPSGNPTASLEGFTGKTTGYVRINSVSNSTTASGTVLKRLGNTVATTLHSRAAWGPRYGYPAAVSFHEQRLWWAGTEKQPNSLWASKIDAYEEYALGTRADDALAFTPAENEQHRIQWMVSQQSLLIGSEASEWVMGSRGQEVGSSATNFSIKRHGSNGGDGVQALMVNNVAIFLQRGGRKIREMAWSFESEAYVATDLTILSEHITRGGVVGMALQQQPFAVVWCVTGGGEMAAFTYDRAQNVTGWARHITRGEFESVAVVYGESAEDEVWVSVKRQLSGQTVRTIERFQPNHLATLDDRRQADCFCVDCGKAYAGPATTTITGLGHLEGETVQILADGAVHADRVVTGGQITLEHEATRVAIGLGFSARLVPTSPEFSDGTTSTHGSERRPWEVTVRLYRSLGFRVSGTGGKTWDRAQFRRSGDHMDQPTSLFDGDFRLPVTAPHALQTEILIEQDQPLPLCVLSATTRMAFTRDQA